MIMNAIPALQGLTGRTGTWGQKDQYWESDSNPYYMHKWMMIKPL